MENRDDKCQNFSMWKTIDRRPHAVKNVITDYLNVMNSYKQGKEEKKGKKIIRFSHLFHW
jgi:hypothetical protein